MVQETPGFTPVEDAYALPAEAVREQLGVDPDRGLGSHDVETRRQQAGPNRLPDPPRDNAVVRFLRHFNDVLIYVLLVAAVLTGILQEWVDMAVILVVVLVNAAIGFIQEGRAEKALEGIRDMLSATASVKRDGSWSTVDAEDLVPGDVVRLSAGDKIPADIRLLDAANMTSEESALTGESVPAEKSVPEVAEGAALGDRTSMVFSGSMLASGAGAGIVVETGPTAEIGRINEMMSEVETLETPLTRQVAVFSKWLSLGVLVVSVALVLVGWLVHGTDLLELLLAAVGFAVAAIPEGLPALITITLALGVQAMARQKAITRKLPAVQTLGSVTTICSDKTGTLTKNEMTVVRGVVGDLEFEVSGSGYDPHGSVTAGGQNLGLDHPALRPLAEAMGAVNDADLVEDEEGWKVVGEPTEGALRSFAAKLDLDRSSIGRRAVLPFSSDYKFMAATLELPGGDGACVMVKGAPDVLLSRSASQIDASGGARDLDREGWERRIQDLSDQGLRVLAAARRPARDGDTDALTPESLGQELQFVGVVGIVDPPRSEAITAVKACQEAGIVIKMITGDHAGTATAIARQMGIDDGAGAITGQELEEAGDDELRTLVRTHNVFARTSPEHKLRLVRALQAEGEVVAMTGDGVNDAPALRRADVGVAMGIKGTEVTKESAEVVLGDDNFSTIETAVEEGRRIYDNLRKAIVFLLPTNGAQSLVMLFAVFFGWTLPLTPLQILWVNMVTGVTLAFAFAFEPAEGDIMKRKPAAAGESIVRLRHIVQIAVASVLISGLTMGVFYWRLGAGDTLESARTVATTVLVAAQVVYLFNVKALETSSLHPRTFLNNKVAWLVVGILTALQLVFIYWPVFHEAFGTSDLQLVEIGMTAAAGVIVFLVMEMAKLIIYGRREAGAVVR
ncbi:HAD family hydrolase [Kocuria coralli]|uniref:HAD family hydrolase n=1 Tax=Kocuria coralli TaxID=1461025 RepID=A0A5J5KVF9_9MICC|nr:HAD family hydrolase [Kocuria coralli]